MEAARRRWQQVLGAFLGRLLPIALSLTVVCPGDLRADQTFTIALPELEGPLTIGIFSADGERVRLLHRDAPVEALPAGLNGLILTWDECGDNGQPVPPGDYDARGIVHGPVTIDSVPFSPERPPAFTDPEESIGGFPADQEGITLRASRDGLLTSRPLLHIRLGTEKGVPALEVEGLPLATLPPLSCPFSSSLTSSPNALPSSLSHGREPGSAILTCSDTMGTCSRTIRGLDKIVPLRAGTLTVSSPPASSPTP